MNAKVKTKWLKALRSGEYDQTTGKLLDRTSEGDKFCCLGVLCNLYAQEHPGTGFRANGQGLYYFDDKNGTLPDRVKKWAGSLKGLELELVRLNDEHNFSFNQIANFIEEKL